MELQEFEQWLNSFLNFEKLPQKNIFWLDTMEHFSKSLNNPELSCPAFHVAGSKGKGSTSAFIASILEEAGLKTGLYTSPHILTFLERITRNQQLLSTKIYEEAADILVKTITSEREKNYLKDRPITWFELVTLYSFLCFHQAKLDAAVFEVGLGGRLDATNVIKPLISCIGPIELEHTEYLGDTVEKIAAEKGGIIKENTPAIIASQSPSVKAVFKQIAKEKNAPVFFTDEICTVECAQNYKYSEKFSSLTMKTKITSSVFSRPLTQELRLTGDFQAQNAALAAIAVKKAFPELSEEIIEKGLSKAFLPGRFEVIKNPAGFNKIPLLILDGAHTPRSVGFTMDTLKKLIKSFNLSCAFNLLFACAADKDAKDIAPLFKGQFKKIYLTKPGNVKQSDIRGLEAAFKKAEIPYNLNEDFSEQIKKALKESEETNSLLLVTGSFYLVSEVKKYLAEA